MPQETTGPLFRAYIRFADGQPDLTWENLTFSKAHWRFHWIKRQFFAGDYRNVKTYGFQPMAFYR